MASNHREASSSRESKVSEGVQPETLLGADRDIIRIHGDIVGQLDVEWEAEVDPDRVANPGLRSAWPLSRLADD